MKTKPQTRLIIPMTKDFRTKLKEGAEYFGFDSEQELLRYISTVVVNQREVSLSSTDDWGEPSPAAARRLNRWAKEALADHKAGKLKTYTNVKDFMRDLNRDIGQGR